MNAGESTTKSFPGASAPPVPPAAVTLAGDRTVAAPADRNLVRLRWAVAAVLAALLVLIAVRLAMVDGLVRRVTIEGPSMAPAWVGAHHRITCEDCQFVFRCDATNVPRSGLAVCPNCGYRANPLTAANLHAGEHVLIDRWKHVWREPSRGEVVAARLSGSAGDVVAKRVAALPGERLEVRGGDLYVAGQLVRKSPAELREVRVLVHDNAYPPRKTPNLPPRWKTASSHSSWQDRDGSFQIAPASPGQAAEEFDWLRYHHWRCTESIAPRTQTVPILDNDSFNQDLSRQLNAVTDVMLTCRVQASGNGQLALAAIDGDQRFEAIIEPERNRVTLLEDGRQLIETPFGIDLSRRPAALEFGLCDQQVLLVAAGRTVLRHPYERKSGSPREVVHPLAVGAGDLTAVVSDLQVWRDLYYLEPLGTPRPWQAGQPLSSGEVALLGDNPPASVDSRHWPGSGGISRSNVLGPVVRPFWSASD